LIPYILKVESLFSIILYFEGGEPFLYYPLMVKGIEIAKNMGLKVGIVTNAYWAVTSEDAKIYLEPLKDKIDDLSISSDKLHWDEEDYAQNAIKAAKEFNIPYSVISLEVKRKRQSEEKELYLKEGQSTGYHRGYLKRHGMNLQNAFTKTLKIRKGFILTPTEISISVREFYHRQLFKK